MIIGDYQSQGWQVALRNTLHNLYINFQDKCCCCLSKMDASYTDELRLIILNSKEPFIIRDTLNWSLVEWKLEKWSELLSSEDLEFRCGKYRFTMEPQWERSTEVSKKKFNELINVDVRHNKKWLYFDYKYLNRYLKDRKELHKCICWGMFGFPEYNSEESTLWIGSEGAHTPCHKDTYGCNLVAQIFGKKRWILFPPDEDLYSTRIPYEESSIYSKLNFFSPNKIELFKDIKQCKSVILEPGEVLFVPNGWWHYVENLEMAISINIWIPLRTDSKEQLKEALVQMFISQIIRDLNTDKQKEVLNPNMEELHLDAQKVWQSVDVINSCKRNCTSSITKSHDSIHVEELFKKYPKYLHKIPNLSKMDFNSLLEDQAARFEHDTECEEEVNLDDDNLSNIINAITKVLFYLPKLNTAA
ncbi:hypothetical protein Trydic_g2103 [Trypoxylus dichotomus]